MKNKKNYKLFLIALGFVIPFFFELFVYSKIGMKYLNSNITFSIDRYIIFVFITQFIICNFIFDRKKIWSFIYKYRYIIGIVLFSYVVLNGYHLSSLGFYNKVIEPSENIESGVPILGYYRPVRSDEYTVTSMHILSQTSIGNDLSLNNTMMGSSDTVVNLYPNLPRKDISVLSKPEYLGFLFLPRTQAYSFYSFFTLFFTFFATFEFFILITNKNKLWSLCGALLITFAPAVQWWDQQILIPSGLTAILLINKFLNSKNISKKIIYSILVGWMGAIYFFNLYPAWMIPYFYLFACLFIWLLYINRKNYKFKDIILLIFIAAIVVIGLVLPCYISSKEIFDIVNNTVYPGERFSTGGSGFEKLYHYVISMFLPFINFEYASNASEASQFLSFYPLPLIVGIKCIYDNYKNKKHDLLLILLVLVATFLSVWNYVEIPHFLAKITLLYMSTTDRTPVTVGFICTILLVYYFAKYQKETSNDKFYKLTLAFIIAMFSVYINETELAFYNSFIHYVSIIFLTFMNYCIIGNFKKINKIIAIILCILALITGATVHPISKGLGVIYDKPVAKEIQKLVKEDQNKIWISVSDSVTISNYALANGAKILNSTNYYPNYNLWNVLDSEEEYEDIWNRYAHIVISLSKEDTTLDLIQVDLFEINLNVNQLCSLDITYIISDNSDLTEYSNDSVDISNIYSNDNMYIYETNC